MDRLSSEKLLKQYLDFLSKCMTACLVQRMSHCLCGSRIITKYEAQVITSQATDMQKASKMIQIVIRKGRSACSSFLKCLGICNPDLYENVTGFQAQINDVDHQHLEKIPFPDKMQFTPYLHISIQNSSLAHCIIGNNNSQCVNCDQQSLLTHNDAIKVDKMAQSESHDRLIPVTDSIHMERTNMECVIIGNHNSMTVVDLEDIETESDVMG